MREESPESRRKLRSGFTTGACATAVSLAAANLLLNDLGSGSVSIQLPKGQVVEFKLERCERLNSNRAISSTIKDAGDDPDVTHLATIFAEVELRPEAGVRFHAAEGVGTVTRTGLSIAVGDAAINPVPRQMMREHLSRLADECGYSGGFEVHVGIVNGENIALKTMNARLGIIGGLSILGTTGIVRPFSCSAYIASITQGMDVAHANGLDHIAASTGSTSEAYIQQKLGLADMALVEMGDFVGAVLKHLKKAPIAKLTICGGFGKISKLAAGNSSLHSHDSSIDFEFLAGLGADLGASSELVNRIKQSNTSIEALKFCETDKIPLADQICRLARDSALSKAQTNVEIDVYCVDKTGRCVGHSDPA
ncbi:MAG: cobalt-precorrin-5B (C(1))-methyltransferase [Gammaproteobacteria bacterium]